MDDISPPTLEAATTVKFNAGQFVSRRKEKISKHYQIKSALGSGGYGEVFLAKHLASGSDRAIKVIEKAKWNPKENEAVINEFNIVKDLDHPNLLKMYEMFEDSRHYYIITDIYMVRLAQTFCYRMTLLITLAHLCRFIKKNNSREENCLTKLRPTVPFQKKTRLC